MRGDRDDPSAAEVRPGSVTCPLTAGGYSWICTCGTYTDSYKPNFLFVLVELYPPNLYNILNAPAAAKSRRMRSNQWHCTILAGQVQ